MEPLVVAGAALRGTASVMVKPDQPTVMVKHDRLKDLEPSAAVGEALREMHPAKANRALGGSPNRVMALRGLVVGADRRRPPTVARLEHVLHRSPLFVTL
jgi:hypothetical protein